MKVPFIDLNRQHKQIKKELMQVFEKVLDSSQFILGEEVKQFETEIASYIGTKYAIGVSNGTNSLLLSLRALCVGPGDEVITTPFTFVATAEVIAILGAKPVFCDIDPLKPLILIRVKLLELFPIEQRQFYQCIYTDKQQIWTKL